MIPLRKGFYLKGLWKGSKGSAKNKSKVFFPLQPLLQGSRRPTIAFIDTARVREFFSTFRGPQNKKRLRTTALKLLYCNTLTIDFFIFHFFHFQYILNWSHTHLSVRNVKCIKLHLQLPIKTANLRPLWGLCHTPNIVSLKHSAQAYGKLMGFLQSVSLIYPS